MYSQFPKKFLAVDIETSDGMGGGSLDPFTGSIALVQITENGDDIRLMRWDEAKPVLEKYRDDGWTFIIHNTTFEMKWFYLNGFWTDNVYDTMIASQIINTGKTQPDESSRISAKQEVKNNDYEGWYVPFFEEDDNNIPEEEERKAWRFSHNLVATVHRYADGVILPKEMATSDWAAEPLSPEQIEYAENDVRYLHKVVENQLKFIEKFGLGKVIETEMKAIPGVMMMWARGVKIDLEAWKRSAAEAGEEAANYETRLNYEMGLELAKRDTNNLTLFGTYTPKPFMVSSPAQLSRFFGIEEATEAALNAVDHPLIRDILDYKTVDKAASTYGDTYLQHIRDGRLHPNLPQAETNTGRFKSRKPNLQNVIQSMFKQMLTAGEGKILLSCDYSAAESRILAYVSGDDAFLKAVESGDVHWAAAKDIFKLPADASRSGVYTINGQDISGDEMRRIGKGLNFGIPYGISPNGLVNRGLVDNKAEAETLLEGYFSAYKQVKKLLDEAVVESMTTGRSTNPFGRHRWYEIPKNGDRDLIKSARSRAARQSQNYQIQSTNADVTKVAIADIYQYLRKTGYGVMVLTVHDSIIVELDYDTAHLAIPTVVSLMEGAADKVIEGMVIPVDFDVGTVVEKRCHVSGIEFKVYSHVYKDTGIEENDLKVAPVVKDILKDSGVDLNDYSASFLKLVEIIDTRDEDWRNNNKGLVSSVRAIQNR